VSGIWTVLAAAAAGARGGATVGATVGAVVGAVVGGAGAAILRGQLERHFAFVALPEPRMGLLPVPR
jgi:uncharacterized membrane protein